MKEVLLGILSGGVAVALVKAIEGIVTWHLNRKAAKEDKAEAKADKTTELGDAVAEFKQAEAEKNKELEETLEELKQQIKPLSDAIRFILLDRILYLGQSYIAKGEISFDDRKRLRDMHDAYHNGLHGNGDADLIMQGVDELPLKK